jgi:hypothetical protein
MALVKTVVTQCKNFIVEYNLKRKAEQSMTKLCRNKQEVILCERFNYIYFNVTNNSTGMNRAMTTKFISTKGTAMLYPRFISNLTCQQNPLMSDITLQIDGRSYPYTPGNSLSTDFIKQNMEDAELNNNFHSTQSVEDSQGKLDSDNTD